MQRGRLRSTAPLLVILLVAFALRAYRLGADSLWYDETVSTYLAGSPVSELIRHTAGDIHPPGYYLLLRGWLTLTGIPDGRAGASGTALETSAAFLSLMWGVLLVALIHRATRSVAGERAALAAAGFAALNPFHVWYSQEVRMYTAGAALGLLAYIALRRATAPRQARSDRFAWPVYAVAAAAGMYTLYYFAFLLVPLNLWALWRALRHRAGRRTAGALAWLAANLGALLLYAPWLPVAWRQAADPPVPPWRSAPGLPSSLYESASALALGQSAPAWAVPVVLLTLAAAAIGVAAIWRRARRSGVLGSDAAGLALGAFAPLLLILAATTLTPLYHVRYVFTYSPFFAVLVGAGVARLWRLRPTLATVAAVLWVAVAGVSLARFWTDPLYRADDHRSAVRELQARVVPGDAIVVNAGYAYSALATYWTGEPLAPQRLTGVQHMQVVDALDLIVTGHVDGDSGLGWGDPRADFFAMPSGAAAAALRDLFATHGRIWQYRIYDTVNDPRGIVRGQFEHLGFLTHDRVYPGEAFMRVQAWAPRTRPPLGDASQSARVDGTIVARWAPFDRATRRGEIVSSAVEWTVDRPRATAFATSLRLVDASGTTRLQTPDERPLGPLFTAEAWPPGIPLVQPLRLTVPQDSPPGAYRLVLLPYDPADLAPLQMEVEGIAVDSLELGRVNIE